jgi:hypothetical protein
MATLKNLINKIDRMKHIDKSRGLLLQVFTPGSHGYLRIQFEAGSQIDFVELHAERLDDGRILIDPRNVRNLNPKGTLSRTIQMLEVLNHTNKIHIPANQNPAFDVPKGFTLDFRNN